MFEYRIVHLPNISANFYSDMRINELAKEGYRYVGLLEAGTILMEREIRAFPNLPPAPEPEEELKPSKKQLPKRKIKTSLFVAPLEH